MDATNKDERKTAIGKFLGIYSLSIIAAMVIAYFLFNTPASILKNKIELFKTTEEEQTKLLAKIDGATVGLTNLVQTDKNYLNTSNEIERGNLQTQIGEYQKRISNAISDVQNDSVSYISPISKKNSYNYITAFTTILSYRNTIGQLQNSLLSKGGDAAELLKAQTALQACNTQLEIAKLAALAASKPAPPPAAGGGGGGGSNNAKEAQLLSQLQKVQDDLESCKKEKAVLLSAQSGNKRTSGDAQKAIVLFDAATQLYSQAQNTKNLIEKRGILSSARQLFDMSSHEYPDADRVNKIIKQIDGELKKLKNMG